MTDKGGDRSKPPLRPRYSRPAPPRPETRPPSVWVVSLLLVLFGLLGALLGAYLLEDAVSHGEEDEVVAAIVFSLLMSAAQVAAGIGVFVGTAWGRKAALTVCGLTIALVVVAAATDSMGSGQAWTAVAVNGALLFALLGEKVHTWCR